MIRMKVGLAVACLVVPLVLGQYDPNIWDGRTAFVHLFEWKWTDIALECERFLSVKGYAAVQVSPANEHRIITDPPYPWYQRYQPVSYKLDSRSGNEAQFRDMVRRCNNVGVRIYVDAVINHMAGGAGVGSSGSGYNSGKDEYPGVPFGPRDFTDRSECSNPTGDIDYQQADQVRNCRLLGMPDLALRKQYTRDMIVGYLDKLVDIGVAGFRIDASKHMWPDQLKDMLSRVKNLPTTWFPPGSRPFVFHEVIDMGSGEPIKAHHYADSGRVTEFRYGLELSKAVLKQGGQLLKHYRNFGEEWGFLDGMAAVTFIDNHDNQRGHGGGGEIVTFRRDREYKIANAFMLAHPYGYPQVMSSYDWDRRWEGSEDKNNWVGPPSGSNGQTSDIVINGDSTCAGRWRCEHRWRQITNMVGFRNAARSGGLVHWWDNGGDTGNQIAFGRGVAGATTAFIVINNENFPLNQALQTGLPSGIYCDIISGNLERGTCTGKSVTVKSDRTAAFLISHVDSDPVIAIHIQAKLT